MTKEELISFERAIADDFNAGLIPFPIHLSGGNEDRLIEIFKEFKAGDYCFSTWRSHSHALLAGVPPAKVKQAIMEGRSITLAWPEHRFLSSAIVAGCCPIALGVAWQIKQRGGKETVWCFIGDMAARTGLFRECVNYRTAFQLPLQWVIEVNGKSVCTVTDEAWGNLHNGDWSHINSYNYELPWPHAGAGVRVSF